MPQTTPKQLILITFHCLYNMHSQQSILSKNSYGSSYASC